MRLPHHLLCYGPGALLLQWEQRISPDISTSVHAYALAIEQHPAVLECVVAYASLLVRFSTPSITAYQLKEYILDLQPSPVSDRSSILHEIPVCYDGPDFTTVAATLKLSAAALIALHTRETYLVYQLGYQPGFAFMGQTPADLAIPRRSSPRARVPAGSVGLAGRQTGIYPTNSPGGWQLIGRCPIP
ncbi:MAG: 5-oxoprolinase subunit PxpB, partial [Bacteroidota bacterium]